MNDFKQRLARAKADAESDANKRLHIDAKPEVTLTRQQYIDWATKKLNADLASGKVQEHEYDYLLDKVMAAAQEMEESVTYKPADAPSSLLVYAPPERPTDTVDDAIDVPPTTQDTPTS